MHRYVVYSVSTYILRHKQCLTSHFKESSSLFLHILPIQVYTPMANSVQCNPSNPDTNGTEESSEVEMHARECMQE